MQTQVRSDAYQASFKDYKQRKEVYIKSMKAADVTAKPASDAGDTSLRVGVDGRAEDIPVGSPVEEIAPNKHGLTSKATTEEVAV
jgi:hypothetical protein